MNLQTRVELLVKLGDYMRSNEADWMAAKEKASRENGWFTSEFIDISTTTIADNFLQTSILNEWITPYEFAADNNAPKTIGIVMAGNIPLVGFHDFLCVFITGHIALIKPSSKDEVLIKHLAGKLIEWRSECEKLIRFATMLKGCDAYIATGSNNSSGYFDYYFKKYPNIIRRNKTSIALLSGNESEAELAALADDVYLYFGLGCRNVTKLYVPNGYDFIPLLNAFRKYDYLAEHHKYKNNYDYNLAILLLNHQFYMSTHSILLVENQALFSPISQLNYSFFENAPSLIKELPGHPDLQGIVGHDFIPFGKSQFPAIGDYADQVDTLHFLKNLQN